MQEEYGEFWGQVPITLAVIPFEHGSTTLILKVENESDKYKALREWEIHASASELSEYHKIHPIGENTELVEEILYAFK